MGDVTQILRAIENGEPRATDELLPTVYVELRRMAAKRLQGENAGNTLQPTALVHEAYVRLVGGPHTTDWESRRHFFFAASRAMRDILVEQARHKAALKRGRGRERRDADERTLSIEMPVEDILALHEALRRLERDDPRKHNIVLLRFFAGLTAEETARIMDISLRTVEREWRYIRARLYRELSAAQSDSVGGSDDGRGTNKAR